MKRATAVTCVLQQEYQMDPTRVIAAGRGEFIPVASNNTEAGRMANQRTRIVIQPQLNDFFSFWKGNN